MSVSIYDSHGGVAYYDMPERLRAKGLLSQCYARLLFGEYDYIKSDPADVILLNPEITSDLAKKIGGIVAECPDKTFYISLLSMLREDESVERFRQDVGVHDNIHYLNVHTHASTLVPLMEKLLSK